MPPRTKPKARLRVDGGLSSPVMNLMMISEIAVGLYIKSLRVNKSPAELSQPQEFLLSVRNHPRGPIAHVVIFCSWYGMLLSDFVLVS